MRACTVAAHLVSCGHAVLLASSGRAAALLRARGFDVLDVRGLHATYARGRVELRRSAARMLWETPSRLHYNAHVAFRDVVPFAPDVALTDFNGFACAAAVTCGGVPVVSLDHQHVIDRFRHPRPLVASFAADFAVARAAVRAKTLGCARYLVTSFFFPEPNAADAAKTDLVGPVVRPEVEALVPSRGEHVLVYQTTSTGARELVETLRAVRSATFRVYGAGIAARLGNVELRAFDERSFLADLASARAVIANGGFTALAEALILGKPVLSVPLVHQAEQQLNAAWLDALGLGDHARRLTPSVVRMFLERHVEHDRREAPRVAGATREALSRLDRAIAEVA
jgi:uncharacterized protein (TIGR00661 family)